MRPELRLLRGGKSRRPIDTSNIVYLEDSRHGVEPPSVIEICDALAPRMPGIGGLHGRALSVFLEITCHRWLRSRRGVGLRVSLGEAPLVAPKRKQGRLQVTMPEPEWTLLVRPPGVRGEHYHVFLPRVIDHERTEVPFLWLTDEGTVLHEVVFKPGERGWRPVAHHRDPALVRFESRDRNTAS